MPDVSGVDQSGTSIRLRTSDAPLVIFFYPKDGTPGCTKEACAFRDAWDRYRADGVGVLGVSSQDRESHEEFAKEHALPFSLIADTDGEWAEAFGVSSFLGLNSRVSFLVGADHRIAKVYPDVDPAIHAETVLRDARSLSDAPPSPER